MTPLILYLFLFFSSYTHRPYWPVLIEDMPTTKHTHVMTKGVVTLIKRREEDGDVHIRLEDDNHHFIVAECIPTLPCKIPTKGDTIWVWGISREDKEHGWYEVHPVEAWEKIKEVK